MTDPAAIVARARSACPPPDWKIHVMPRRPVFAMALVTFFVTGWATGAVVWGVRWALSRAGAAPTLLDWSPLPVVITVVVTVGLIVGEFVLRGLVVITEQEVVVFAPMQLRHRVGLLGFSTIRGMALQRVDSEGADTPAVITTYRLALRLATGKEEPWSPNVRYRYPKRGPASVAVYLDVIDQFERGPGSDQQHGLTLHVGRKAPPTVRGTRTAGPA